MLQQSRISGDTLTKILHHPAMQKMAGEIEAERAKDRQKLGRELTERRKSRPALMAQIQADVAKAQKQVDDAVEGLRLAKANFSGVTNRTCGEAWGMDQKILELEGCLMASAPAELRTALDMAIQKLENLRKKSVDSYVPSAVDGSLRGHNAVKERGEEIKAMEKEIEGIKAKIYGGE